MSTPDRNRERDDPRDEVGNFERPHGGGRRAPDYLPNRVIAERAWFWEERAAIRQFDDGVERWIADRLAYDEDLVKEIKSGRLK